MFGIAPAEEHAALHARPILRPGEEEPGWMTARRLKGEPTYESALNAKVR